MREIKFRGLDMRDNKFRYGDLTRYSKEMSYINEDLLENKVYQVFTNTVGQYTGLKDRNDIEIYEGDILKAICRKKVGYEEVTKNNKIQYLTVEPKIQYWTVEHKIFNGYMGFMFYGTDRRWNTMISKNIINNCKCEVVGNIYENKELLDDNKQ